MPKKVVAIYSGEDKRLFRECYEPFYLDFIRNISKGNEYSELPKMLYLNKYYWHIALLCLLVSNSEDNIDFVKNRLKIDSIDSIRFDFSAKNYKNYQDNVALQLVKLIDNKNEYTLQEFKDLVVKDYIPDEIFKLLYLAFTPESSKIITGISIKFNNGLQIDAFSEGEKKLLLIKAALEFGGQEDTLFILDEPDAHVHIANKELIVNSFENYKENRQIIITTHSPTLTQCVKDENVYMLNNGKIEDKNRQAIIQEITGEFWNKHQQSSFLSSKKPIVLLVEGKHDKEHINNAFEKLKDKYGDLSFDIFSLNSESKIHPFMNGLYEADLKDGKLYIGIYDNDKAGQDTLNKAGFNSEVDNCGYRKLKKDKLDHNNFYAFLLPKTSNFKSDFTIENMFPIEEYKTAYEAAIKDFQYWNDKSIDEISKDIKEKSKNILSENSKKFSNDSFEHFKKLFEIIRKIKKCWKPEVSNEVSNNTQDTDKGAVNEKTIESKVHDNLNTENSLSPLAPNTNEISDFVSSPNIEDRIKSHNEDENRIPYLEFWESFRAFVEEREVSFKLQKPAQQNFTNITIGKTGYKICASLSHQKKRIIVQLVVNGKDSRQNFLKLQHEHEDDSKKNLSPNISWEQKEGKEQHINMMKTNVEISKKDDWEHQFSFLMEWIEKFYHYFKDKI